MICFKDISIILKEFFFSFRFPANICERSFQFFCDHRLVGPWEGLPHLKKLTRGRSDDWADRMSHVYTVLLLLAAAILVSTAHLVGDRIRCWTPAEFTDAYEDYVHNYCWIKNTYFIPQHDYIPADISLHQVINYFENRPPMTD